MTTRSRRKVGSNAASQGGTLFVSTGSHQAKRMAGESIAHAKKNSRSREQHALKTVLTACLDEIVADSARMKAGRPETVHRLRVAGRRLQAALRMFREVHPNEMDQLRGRLNWLIDELGSAREIDTFIEDVLKPAMGNHDVSAFAYWAYRRSLVIRRKAYHQANLMVSSREYKRLIEDLRKVSASGKASFLDAKRVEIQASRFLCKMRQKLYLKEKVRNLNSRQLHKLRLRAKRMRYGVEIAMLIASKRTARACLGRLLASLSRLQSALGAINDLIAHKKRLRNSSKTYEREAELLSKRQLRILLPKPNKERRALLKKASRAHDRALRIAKQAV